MRKTGAFARAVANGRLSEVGLDLFEQIRRAVDALPAIELGSEKLGKRPLTPHLLVRALARAFGTSYQDGYYHLYIPHAWLVTEAGNVIDVWPVGGVGAVLVDTGPESPLRNLYEPCAPISFGEHFGGNTFRNDIRAVTLIIRRTRERLSQDV
jgi:hypothetical protein